MAYSGTEEKTGENLIRLSVPDMDCPVEEGEIRAELEKMSGISSIAADTARRTLEVKTDSVPDEEDILAALERAGHPGKILPGSPENGSEQIVILVPEMDCAVEARENEEALSSHPEIPDGVFDTRRRTVREFPVVRATARLEFLDVVRGTGYSAQLALRKSSDPVETSIPWKKLGTALVLAFAAELIPDFAPAGGSVLTLFGHRFSTRPDRAVSRGYFRRALRRLKLSGAASFHSSTSNSI
ncbi:MAG: cation transporter [Dakarella massiliensis]